MLVSVFAACGETGPSEATTEAVPGAVTTPEPGTEEDTSLRPDLPDTVWNREFRILGGGDTRNNSFPSFELYAEELEGEAMNDAIFNRNETIRGKYGITIEQTLEKDTDTIIAKDYSAGEDRFDLVFAYIKKVGGLAQKGYFVDINTIDNVDLEKPWWNSNINDVVSVKGHVYYASNDFSLRDKNRVQVLMCNDKLREENKLEAVSGLVRSNAWTAEKMNEYVTAVSIDLNGDGQHTSTDQYGLVVHSYDAFAALCFGCGLRLIDKDDTDGLVIVDDPDRNITAIDAVFSFCRTETFMTPEHYNRNWDISFDTYCEGRSLFNLTLLHSVGNYNKDCEFDFTVCPLPKLNADQEKYNTIPDVFCMLFAVPVTCSDTAFAGFALEAYAYASTDTTLVTFIELLCKTRNVRNAESVEMINVILDGVVYDNSIFYYETVGLYGMQSRDSYAITHGQPKK